MFKCPRCKESTLMETEPRRWGCQNHFCGNEYLENEPLSFPSFGDDKIYEMMPLLEEWNGYKLYFEKGEVITHPYQPHVHVKGHGGHVKVVLEPDVYEEKSQTYGLRQHRVDKILKHVSEKKNYLLEKWNEAKRDAGLE